jgi:ubiquinone/menaquinone biosynthesis C-methylase UbiE
VAHLPLPDQSVDLVYSRFGVMFFADPIQAFGNLWRMLRPGGRIGFVCWRSIQENELNNWAAGKFLRLEPTELDAKRRRLLTYRFTVNG